MYDGVCARGDNSSYRQPFFLILGFFVDSLLADQFQNSGMVTGFGKLSTRKRHKQFKNPPNIWQCSCQKGQWWLQAAVLLNFVVFMDNTCQALLADQLESSGMTARFGKLSTQKNNLRTHQIYDGVIGESTGWLTDMLGRLTSFNLRWGGHLGHCFIHHFTR